MTPHIQFATTCTCPICERDAAFWRRVEQEPTEAPDVLDDPGGTLAEDGNAVRGILCGLVLSGLLGSVVGWGGWVLGWW